MIFFFDFFTENQCTSFEDHVKQDFSIDLSDSIEFFFNIIDVLRWDYFKIDILKFHLSFSYPLQEKSFFQN